MLPLILILILAVPAAWAEDTGVYPPISGYSTELVVHIQSPGKKTMVQHIKEYYSKTKFRVDFTMETASGKASFSTIARLDKNVQWKLMPQQGEYLESPLNPDQMAQMHVPLPQERSKARIIGTAAINGQPVDKYNEQEPSGSEQCTQVSFLSKSTGFPVSAKTHCGVTDVVTDFINTKLGEPPASIFDVPAGYKKSSS